MNKLYKEITNDGFQLSGYGFVRNFETKLKEHYQKEWCITFNSCTNALFLLLNELEIKKNKVLTSCFGWPGMISVFRHFDNEVKFIDTKEDLILDISQMEISYLNEFKVIFAVDFAGNPCDTKLIKRMTTLNNAIYIADASQSFGSELENGLASSCEADVVLLSFTKGKPLDLGGGAAILTNEKDIFKALLKSQHAYRQKLNSNELVYYPMNCIIHPFSAYYGFQLFDKKIKQIQQRKKKMNKYLSFISKTGLARIPQIKGSSNFYYTYILQSGTEFINLNSILATVYPELLLSRNKPFGLLSNSSSAKELYQLITMIYEK